jgi:hypothetical protein
MELLGAAVVAGVIAVVYFSGAKGASATLDAFTGYFRGFQRDPWPVGVQEEDRDRPWGARLGRLPIRGADDASRPWVEEILRWRRSDRVVPVQHVRGVRLRSRF